MINREPIDRLLEGIRDYDRSLNTDQILAAFFGSEEDRQRLHDKRLMLRGAFWTAKSIQFILDLKQKK